MRTEQVKQSHWIDAEVVNIDYVSNYSILDFFVTVVLMGIVVGLVSPLLV